MWSVSSEGVRWWRVKFERTGTSGFTLGFFVHRHHIWKWEAYGRVWWRGERKWDGFKSGRWPVSEVEKLYRSYRPDSLPEHLREKLWAWCCHIVRQRTKGRG